MYSSLDYRPEVDGLRALAVLLVIFFHAGFPVLSGGYVGVDVFFVISGYLIASIIFKQLEEGSFSLVNFYQRRARRILPALFFVVLCCIPFAWLWMPADHLSDFGVSLVGVMTFSSNVTFWLQQGYFSNDAELSPLLHTWSLAVEEQFYVLFPLMVLLFWNYSRFFIVFLFSSFFFLSFSLAQYLSETHASANFYLILTRSWEIGIGVLCAFFNRGRGFKSSNFLSLIGFFSILLSAFFYDASTPFPSGYALLPVLGSALIIIFAKKDTLLARILSFKPFVFVGLISFSAYLWHQPILAFARIRSLHELSVSLSLVLALFSLLLGAITWNYVEKPFRAASGSFYLSDRTFLALTITIGFSIFSVGVAAYLYSGFPSRISMPDDLASSLNERPFKDECFGFSLEKMVNTGLFCELGSGEADFRVAVVGDSHSLSFVLPLHSLAKERGASIIYSGIAGCPPLKSVFVLRAATNREACNYRNSHVFSQLVERDVDKVILISRWSYYSTGDAAGGFVYIDNIYNVSKSKSHSMRVFKASLYQTFGYLQSEGIDVLVFHQPPVQSVSASRYYNWAAIFDSGYLNHSLSGMSVSKDDHLIDYIGVKSIIENQANKFSGVKTFDLSKSLCEGNVCWIGKEHFSYYLDRDHLSTKGAAYVLDGYEGYLFD